MEEEKPIVPEERSKDPVEQPTESNEKDPADKVRENLSYIHSQLKDGQELSDFRDDLIAFFNRLKEKRGIEECLQSSLVSALIGSTPLDDPVNEDFEGEDSVFLFLDQMKEKYQISEDNTQEERA